jgi:Double zinc ribbon
MTSSDALTCPACGAVASGNFCSACGAGLGPLTCAACRAELSPQARFCHHCGHPVPARRVAVTERKAWLIAASLCLLLVGAIVYKVTSAEPGPVTPDMANAGTSTGAPSGVAPDISQMTPRERFDRLFNRIMLASERRDAAEVQRFTPMALGAYSQLDTIDVDARYHAAVLRVQVGDLAGARALADTILTESRGHLFGYLVRGTVAKLQGSQSGLRAAQREFLAHYDAEMKGNRVEYLEHRPVLEEFRQEAESGKSVKSESKQ